MGFIYLDEYVLRSERATHTGVHASRFLEKACYKPSNWVCEFRSVVSDAGILIPFPFASRAVLKSSPSSTSASKRGVYLVDSTNLYL